MFFISLGLLLRVSVLISLGVCGFCFDLLLCVSIFVVSLVFCRNSLIFFRGRRRGSKKKKWPTFFLFLLLVFLYGTRVLKTRVPCEFFFHFSFATSWNLSHKLEFLHWTRVLKTRDANFFNSFRNMLTNEIVSKIVLICTQKKNPNKLGLRKFV